MMINNYGADSIFEKEEVITYCKAHGLLENSKALGKVVVENV